MADINYVPQVDYTSKDFAAIRDDMISLIPNYLPNWTNRDPADFGITLIELFAYMGDVLNYYIDRAANEAFIGTATQRDSVLQIARLLGYAPSAATASTVTVRFYNSSGNPITVPALTQVATTASSTSGTQIIFETNTAVTVPAKSGTVNGQADVACTQGYTVTNEPVGISTGEINQVWALANSPLIQGSLSVTAGVVPYTQVPYLIDYTNYDPVFSVYTNAAGTSYVLFGDNISGRVPDANAALTATYRVGGGATGNVAIGAIKSVLTNSTSGLSVTNLVAASGGADQESTDSIRANAPLSLKSLNRAVSLADYASLVKSAGVAKANAIADVYSSVTVFFAPYGDSGVQVDGVTPSTIFNNLAATVKTFLIGKIPANTTVTFQPPSYVPVNISANITVLPQYRSSLVTTAVNSVLASLLAFDNVSFADKITLNDVTKAINSVSGVGYTQVTRLVRNDADVYATISNKAASGTVATITTSAAHGLNVGDTVQVSISSDTTFSGTFVVTGVPTTTTFTYALISSVVTTTTSTGTAYKLTTKDVVCGVNEIPTLNNTATGLVLTFTGGINN